MRSGRFEWITVLPKEEDHKGWENETTAFPAKECPICGWIDSNRKFSELAEQQSIRECFRCGSQWGVEKEISEFFYEEEIDIPPVALDAQIGNWKQFFRSDTNSSRLFDLHLASERLGLRRGYDDLLALSAVRIDRFSHQIKTARMVLQKFRGRALLADEVGLGKTIEAGLVVKELLLRGVAESVLIMTPAGLTAQWKEELQFKFAENFQIFKGKGPDIQNVTRLIVSYDLAKRREGLLNRAWDVIIMDEAHRLKGRNTLAAKFARKLRSRYLLLLTATPVQNNLDELYSLIDLISPGRLGTVRSFRSTYVSRSNPRKLAPGRNQALKNVLSEVMVRNRRDNTMRFPRRRAGIYHIVPSAEEIALYDSVTSYVKEEFKKELLRDTGRNVHMLSLIILQRELMSTPDALARTLRKIAARKGYPAATVQRLHGFAEMAAAIEIPSKIKALKEIVMRYRGRRFVVFTEFIDSLACISRYAKEWGLPVFNLSGKQTVEQRASAIDAFRNSDTGILVSTEAGGIGFNLQFCHMMVNFDLPWNPTRIEQRIGRLDRIGQKKEVYVFNLVCRDTIEEHIVEVLGKKLRMFEMVIGECGAVLGHLDQNKSFEQLVTDVWGNSRTKYEEQEGFRLLARKVSLARSAYEQNKEASRMLDWVGSGA
jgi:SNF2 family DNA or RNA helicase